MSSSLWRYCLLPGQSGANELRAASEPCCVGAGDGAGGSAVVGLDPDAGLIDACTNTGAYVAANPADSGRGSHFLSTIHASMLC